MKTVRTPDLPPIRRILTFLALLALGIPALRAEEKTDPGIIFFSHDLTASEAEEPIKKVADAIAKAPDTSRFRLEGHASDVGEEDVNQYFSEQRAQWVLDQLVKNHKLDAKRFDVLGHGELKPYEEVKPDDSLQEKARKRKLNRRVEIFVLYKEGEEAKPLASLLDGEMNTRGLPDTQKKPDKEKKEMTIADSANATAIDLFRKIATSESGQNILLSPHSIAQTMMMARLGAGSETEAEFEKALHLAKKTPEQIAEANQKLRSDLSDSVSAGAVLNIANGMALVGEQGKALDTYQDVLTNSFAADIIPNANLDTINGWVADQTKGKIEKLLTELDPESRIVLLNALYFQADWKDQFDSKLTEDKPFTLQDGSTVDVPMMFRSFKVPVIQEEKWTAVSLPYLNPNLVWLALLPAEGNQELLEKGLDADVWSDLIKTLAIEPKRSADITLPRIDLEGKADLGTPFKELGVELAFSRNADFSKMSEEALMISQIQHAVKLVVNEKGSEAAAATAVEFKSRGLGAQPVKLRFDRPFLFAIAERRTGSLLLLGRISNPGSK